MRIKIFCPIYIEFTTDVRKSILSFLNNLIKSIDARITDIKPVNTRFLELEIVGSQNNIAKNFFYRTFGYPRKIDDLSVGTSMHARIVDINATETLLDIGLTDNILVYMRTSHLLARLLGIKEKLLSSQLIERILRYSGLGRYFPIDIELTRVVEKKLIGTPTRSAVYAYQKWLNMRLDRILVFGSIRSRIDKILLTRRIHRRIIRVERIGPLEFSIVLRFGEFADNYLDFFRGISQAATIFMPRKLRKILKEAI